jgi:hypothetical protein
MFAGQLLGNRNRYNYRRENRVKRGYILRHLL